MTFLRRKGRAGRDRGSASIELAILTPAVIGFMVAVVIAGRYNLALQISEAAAYDAARSASLSRTPTAAINNAQAAAAASFASQGIRCSTLTVNVNTAGFSATVGTSATVTVSVTCITDFDDVIIALPLANPRATLRATFTSPLDTYRSRS